jgi:hypothetical protein
MGTPVLQIQVTSSRLMATSTLAERVAFPTPQEQQLAPLLPQAAMCRHRPHSERHLLMLATMFRRKQQHRKSLALQTLQLPPLAKLLA